MGTEEEILNSSRVVAVVGLSPKPERAENLTIEGIDLVSLPTGTRMSIGEEVILEVTQIGEECHTGCAIYRRIGKPRRADPRF